MTHKRPALLLPPEQRSGNRGFLIAWLLCSGIFVLIAFHLWQDSKQGVQDMLVREQYPVVHGLQQQLHATARSDSATPLARFQAINWQALPAITRTGQTQSLQLNLFSQDGRLLYIDYPSQQQAPEHLLGEQAPLRVIQSVTTAARGQLELVPSHLNLTNQKSYHLVSADQHSQTIIELSIPAQVVYQQYREKLLISAFFWLLLSLVLAFTRHIIIRWQRQTQVKEHTYLQALDKAESTTSLFINNIQGCVYKSAYPSYLLTFVTQGSENIFNCDAQVLISRQASLLDFIHPDDKDAFLRQLEKHIREQSAFEFIFRLTLPDQEIKWVMNRGRVTIEKNGVLALEGLLLDITDHKLSQQQVEYLATRDPLTELANRYCFNDEIINHINSDQEHEIPFALLYIDLDRFKTINDSLGHQLGDRLLKLVAERLHVVVEDRHLLSRLGGDEFIIMMKEPSGRDEIIHLAKRVTHTLSQTFQLDYYKLSTSCSIGISLYPDDSTESYVLMRNADTAMYKAKEKGGNCYQFFTTDMNRQAHARLTLENELRKAIKTHQFEVFYQPQVSTWDNRLLGAEALVRWNHPQRGIISPVDFIPIAEETGLIKDIGDWVLDEACRTFSQWNQEFGLKLQISVNVSVRQLDDLFVFRVQELLKKHNMPASQLELEITESLLMDNPQENIRLLENINKLGVEFAMDDFGTGYSSLSYLKQFPVSKLKIDRAFINDITTDKDDEAIVRAIIAMAKTLKLKLVAEGVENHEQLSRLRDLECDSYQGYYFSKPLPQQVFYERHLLTAESRRSATTLQS